MGRNNNKLTVSKVRANLKAGRHSDGGGLYLKVRKSGSKSWVFMHRKKQKVTEVGLGSAQVINLMEAREAARKIRERMHLGLPLKEEIIIEQKPKSFIKCVDLFLKAKEAGWKSDKHRAQWHMTLNVYAKPLHNLCVTDIRTPHVLSVLRPMWLSKNETASRLRGRIEAVLDYAKAMGWRSGENPALWRGNLKLLLPQYSRTQNIKHHAALPYEDMQIFMSDLRMREATVARLLEFIILTAARSGEARFSTWDEVNFEKRVWTLSAERMKMSKPHIVSLSNSCCKLLTTIFENSSPQQTDYIFKHPTRNKPFSVNATRSLLKRMRDERLTTHGFRSTFRDWTGDKTYHQRETIEAALAHTIKNKAEAAYRRSTALEKRRSLMQDWDDFCSGKIKSTQITNRPQF